MFPVALTQNYAQTYSATFPRLQTFSQVSSQPQTRSHNSIRPQVPSQNSSHSQTYSHIPIKIPVKLIVGGHENLTPQITSFFGRELRALRDIRLTEDHPELQIKVDGMETQSQTGEVRFVISIIILKGDGTFVANDLGFGQSMQELKEIAINIVAQVDAHYLKLLREPQMVHTEKRVPPPAPPPAPSTTHAGALRWVLEKLEDGRFIHLDDQTLWEISPYDRSNSSLWLPSEEIFIIATDEEDYPYKLINKTTEDTANARLVVE